MIATANQGDTVDALCYRHLGVSGGMNEQVYALNPGLASLGPILPMGTRVTLPDVAPAAPSKELIQLWD